MVTVVVRCERPSDTSLGSKRGANHSPPDTLRCTPSVQRIGTPCTTKENRFPGDTNESRLITDATFGSLFAA